MEDNVSVDIVTVGLAGYILQLFIYHFPTEQDGEKTVPTGKKSGAFVIDNAPSFFYTSFICESLTYMDRRKIHGDGNFRIDPRGYDTDDPVAREERVDVSPAGTEGIFIDTEHPECDGEKR